MHDLHRAVLAAMTTLAVACTPDTPTRPSALRPSTHEEKPGPGGDPGGPELHSQNVKLLANVARPNARTQSDLAFQGRLAFAGNYGGFRIIDIADPEHPVVVSTVTCNGAQGDVSVHEHLLFQSVDDPQSSSDCASTDAPVGFEGLRVFDVTNPAAPVHVASVPTDCGSHTHTLVPDPPNDRVVIYVSSYPTHLGPDCAPPMGYISIVSVPLGDPGGATVSRYHLDGATEAVVDGASYTGCHDIAVFLELGLAAASCISENQIWDIADPDEPEFLWRFDHPAVGTTPGDFWHSATFSWDGRIVAFGDESIALGGLACTDPSGTRGRVWFVDVTTRALRGTYKIPRQEPGFCTAHYFNFVPLAGGRKVLVSAWYTGGTSIVDVDKLLAGATAAQAEVGFFRPSGAITWSSYWLNGFILTNDIERGVDVMLLSDKIRAAARKLTVLNPQTQVELIP